MISYRSSLRFVPVQWFLAELWPLNFETIVNLLNIHDGDIRVVLTHLVYYKDPQLVYKILD